MRTKNNTNSHKGWQHSQNGCAFGVLLGILPVVRCCWVVLKPFLVVLRLNILVSEYNVIIPSVHLSHPCYLCRVAAVKSLTVHLINDVIFSILEDRSARQYCCVYMLYGTFSFFYSAFFYLGGSSVPTWMLYNHP
jgi:hypothetical protein